MYYSGVVKARSKPKGNLCDSFPLYSYLFLSFPLLLLFLSYLPAGVLCHQSVDGGDVSTELKCRGQLTSCSSG